MQEWAETGRGKFVELCKIFRKRLPVIKKTPSRNRKKYTQVKMKDTKKRDLMFMRSNRLEMFQRMSVSKILGNLSIPGRRK